MKSTIFIALAGTAIASTIRIDVGQSGFTFSPSTVNASTGDILEFHFHALNHSVVQGDWSKPCQPIESGGFFSGFMPTASGENSNVFQVTVNSTDPIFYYCSQNTLTHCKNGMAGAVNPTSDQTLAAYQNNAMSVDSAGSPPAPFGGLVVAASGSSTASPSSSAPAATSTCLAANAGSGGYRRRDNTCTNAASGGAVASVVAVLVAAGMAVLMA